MRAARLAAVSLTVLLFGLARMVAAADDCEEVQEKLKEGQYANGSLALCANAEAPQLAAALASFLKQEATLSGQSRSLLVAIRDEAKDKNRQTLFYDFSVALQSDLAGTNLRFAIPATALKVNFDALELLLSPAGPPPQRDPTPRLGDDFERHRIAVARQLKEIQNQVGRLEKRGAVKWMVNALAALAIIGLVSLGGVTFLGVVYHKLKQGRTASSASPPPPSPLLGPDGRLQRIDPGPPARPTPAIPPPPSPPPPTVALASDLAAAVAGIPDQITAALVQPNERLAALEETAKGLDLAIKRTWESAAQARSEVAGVKAAVARERPPVVPPSPASAAIELERAILREAWQKFQRENREVLVGIEGVREEGWKAIREPLLMQLPKAVPEDLKPTFDAMMAPARDFDIVCNKLAVINRLAKNEFEALPDAPQELMRLREFTSLLAMIQNSNLVADRLSFRLGPWIADRFLGFADLFLQKHQQAQLDNLPGEKERLAPGLAIVLQVLRAGDLEPVEVILGVTPFDSSRHVGRSTANDANMADGVIVGVVRNGFVRGGQRVIRQPEVIVNRIG